MIVSPLSGVVLLPNGHSWLIHGGDPNHLLTRMILQVGTSVWELVSRDPMQPHDEGERFTMMFSMNVTS